MTGIVLHGGKHTNDKKIVGYAYGVVIYGAAGYLTNLASGSIAGTASDGVGVRLAAGGAVTNSGSIYGGEAGVYLVAGGAVSNAGKIDGGEVGLLMGLPDHTTGRGGTLYNKAEGSIRGECGLISWGKAAAVTNAGVIDGTKYVIANLFGVTFAMGTGVYLGGGGEVLNKAGGTVVGASAGVSVGGASERVTNAGMIKGKLSVVFEGSGESVLTLETGSTLIGEAEGSGFGTTRLVLKGTGTANNEFKSFTDLNVLASGTWTFGSASSFASTWISKGTLDITGALTTRVTENASSVLSFSNSGRLILKGMSTLAGSVSGTGEVDINSDAKLTLESAVGSGDTFTFTGTPHGELQLDDLDVRRKQLFHGVIAGFVAGDTIDVGSPFATSNTPPTTTFVYKENNALTAGVLTLTDGSAKASINLVGDYLTTGGHDFHLMTDGHGGTLITYS